MYAIHCYDANERNDSIDWKTVSCFESVDYYSDSVDSSDAIVSVRNEVNVK